MDSSEPFSKPSKRVDGNPAIVFLTRAFDTGGAQRQLVELASGLHRLGWKVQVVTFYRGEVLEQELRNAGVVINCLDKGGRWDVLAFVWRLVKTIRRAQPDIVHGYLDVSNILLAFLHSLFPATRVVWGVRASNVDLTRYGVLSQVVFRVSALMSGLADLIICNSEAGRTYCTAHGYSGRRMVVIPNGVDVQQFRPDEHARQAVRSEWGVSENARLVGLIARFDPMKDHPNFLRAAAQVLAVRPDTRFVCVGAGPVGYLGTLMKTGEELGLADHVIWAGPRADMCRVYNALDLAVSSSSFGEGTSNAIAEAMATGVPCAATDVGDSRLLIGDLGVVCPPADSRALANAMLEALQGPPRNAVEIRHRISTHFGSDALVKRTAEQLRLLLDAGIPAPHAVNQRVKCQR